MTKQPRQQRARKMPLHVEAFERRNLLSGMHPWWHPMQVDASLSALIAIQPSDVDLAVLKKIEQALVKLSLSSWSSGIDVQIQPGGPSGAVYASFRADGARPHRGDSPPTASLPVNPSDNVGSPFDKHKHHDVSADALAIQTSADSTPAANLPATPAADQNSVSQNDSSQNVLAADNNAADTATTVAKADNASTSTAAVSAIVNGTNTITTSPSGQSSLATPTTDGGTSSTAAGTPVAATAQGTTTISSAPSGDNSSATPTTDSTTASSTTINASATGNAGGQNASGNTPNGDGSIAAPTTDHSSTADNSGNATVDANSTGSRTQSNDSLSAAPATDGGTQSLSADIHASASGDVTGKSANEDSPPASSSSEAVSADRGGTHSVNSRSDRSEAAVVSVNASGNERDKTDGGGNGNSGTNVGASVHAPPAVDNYREVQSSSDPNGVGETALGISNATSDNAQESPVSRLSGGSAVEPLSSGVSASALDNTGASPVENIGSSSLGQAKGIASGSGTSNVEGSGRIAAANSVNAENSASRSLTAAAASEPARSANFSSARDAFQGRLEADTNLNRGSADGAILLATRISSTDSATGSTQSVPTSDRLGLVDRTSLAPEAKTVQPISGSTARHASPVELSSTDLYFGTHALSQRASRETGDEDGADSFEQSLPSGCARGAGLLGSPLLDMDSLASEAQEFFDQLQHLSQDLGNLFAHANLLSGTVAIGLAVTGAAIARQRGQRSERDLVLDRALATLPGLGGPWAWQES